MAPTIGRIVNYRLLPDERGNGNMADMAPAIITAVWAESGGGSGVNLRVFLDGEAVLWRTSVREGQEPGEWLWPVRV